MRPARYDHDKIRNLAASMKAAEVAREIGCSYQTVLNVLGKAPSLAARTPVRDVAAKRETASRFAHDPLEGQTARLPPFNHPALMEARTIYPTTVRHESQAKNGLKSGVHAGKIGGVVRKGRWKGMPIYTLTLEERATCPTSCRHWRSCYGNQMHLAERLRHGDDLLWRLEREIAWLELQNRDGFVVRLHVLGDFYSVDYVPFWERMLERHKALRIFGYTARVDYHGDPIAKALADLVQKNWARCAIRFSNADMDGCATVSIEHPFQKPADAIICPAQLGKTESCSTCALCWQSTRRIAFLQH